MVKLAAAVVLLVAVLAAVVSLDRPGPRADFTLAFVAEVNTLDPQRMSWEQDLETARFVFECLVRNDPADAAFGVVPGVAERWEVSADGREYRFFLRPGARWSNGERVLAGHFVSSWRRGLLPDVASDFFSLFALIEGGTEFAAWRTHELAAMERGESGYADGAALWRATVAEFERRVSLRAEGEGVLWLRLARPVPYFLDLLALPVFAPVYPPLVERFETADARTGRVLRRPGWTKGGVLVSNGPFRLERWRFRREMRFTVNEHYWDRASLALRSVAVLSIPDPNAQVLAFQTGVVDWLVDVTAGYRGDMVRAKRAFRAEHAEAVREMEARGVDRFSIDRLLPADERAHVHTVTAFATYFWNFNCGATLPDGRTNPFADARVRRAFAMCVDKRAIVDDIRRLGEPTAGALVPPGALAGYTPPRGLPNVGDAATEDERRAIVAEARRLLAEAGYAEPARDFPVTVELLFNKDAGHDLVAQAIAKNWQEHLGVRVSLAQKDLKVFRNDLSRHDYMTSRASWFADYPDPTTFLEICRTGDGNNDRDFSHPVYDALLDRAAEETDAGARLALLAEAERVLMEEQVPMIPLFHYVDLYMFDPKRVTGLSTHPRTTQYVGHVDVLGDGVGPDVPRPVTAKGGAAETRP